MIIRHILSVVVASAILIFSGCNTIEPSISTDTIITKYTQVYIQASAVSTNVDNHDIAAMLQTFTVDLIKHPSSTWGEVERREQFYIDSVRTNVISVVYTLRACSNEVDIVDGFCDEVIYYYSQVESDYAEMAGDFLGNASTRFIINMDNYEYEKINSKGDR
jgi:hypothetical protein